MNLLLGIDVGTTSLKAGLFSPDGHCLGIEREEYRLDTPSVEKAQLDVNLYWEACVRTVRNLLKRTDIDVNSIAALAVSSRLCPSCQHHRAQQSVERTCRNWAKGV